jgi:hypothetical protein
MYKIVSADWIPDLEETIDKMILNGWKPVGGLSVVGFPNGVTKFFQSMIKIEFV